MAAFIIVLFLLAGYLRAEAHPKTKFKLTKSSGWNTYFLVGRCAILPASIGMLITAVLALTLNLTAATHENLLLIIWGTTTLAAALGSQVKYLADHSIFTQFKAALTPPNPKTKSGLRSKIQALISLNQKLKYEYDAKIVQEGSMLLSQQNELEHLLYNAAANTQTILITLKSGKTYIGLIINTVPPNNDQFEYTEYFSIIPIFSGYRDKDTQEFKLTTTYDYRALSESEHKTQSEQREEIEEIMNKFKVLILVSEVSVISLFNIEHYTHFLNQSNSKQTP